MSGKLINLLNRKCNNTLCYHYFALVINDKMMKLLQVNSSIEKNIKKLIN